MRWMKPLFAVRLSLGPPDRRAAEDNKGRKDAALISLAANFFIGRTCESRRDGGMAR